MKIIGLDLTKGFEPSITVTDDAGEEVVLYDSTITPARLERLAQAMENDEVVTVAIWSENL